MKKNKKQVVIFGTGGHGRVVLDILRSCNINVFGFLDSDSNKHGIKVNGVKVWGGISFIPRLIKKKNLFFIIAIGDNKIRKAIYFKIKKLGGEITNAIHSSAIIASNAELGEGIAIAAGTVLCTNSCVGDNSIINTGSIVEHDNIIGNHVHIAPGVNMAGGVNIKDGSFIGLGSTIKDYVTIGENAVIGAGSVVINDIPDNVTAVGVPAKVIKNNA